MTLLLAALSGGGSVDEGTYMAPYFVGGGVLILLIALILGLLAFGKGREHS